MGPIGIQPPLSASAARLQLTAHRDGRQGMLDGAWWPRSRDLDKELPALITEIRRQGGQISRISYHPDTWEPAPRTVTVDGATVKLGWFRSMDPHVLTLTGVYGAGRLDLLVVPPDSLAAPADWLMTPSNHPDNRQSASAVLLGAAAAESGPLHPASSLLPGSLASLTHHLSPA